MRRASTARAILATLAPLALAACAVATTSQPGPVDTPSRALIYGHIKAPKPIQAVELAKPMSARRPKARVLENGDFYFENIEPGDYALMRFMAGGEWYSLLTGDKENNRRFMVQAKPGATHFVGTWRVTGVKNNFFSPDQFTIERTDAPPGHAVLQRLRPALAGTGWENRIAPGNSGNNAGAQPKVTEKTEKKVEKNERKEEKKAEKKPDR
jgi:hypothetical protein